MANDEKNIPKQTDKEKEPKKPEIEPLSDEALEDVSGGDSSSGCCSCDSCSSGVV